MKRGHWEAARRVRRGMHLPSHPRDLTGGEIWVVMMVKNEQDIIESTVRHAFSQGVDRVLIVDNLSTDDTPNILQRLAKEFPLLVGEDREPTYFQSEKMTYLLRWAGRHGAQWVVPTDADEFWYAEDTTVADFLRNSDASKIEAPLNNLFPLPQNDNPTSLTTGPLRYDFGTYILGKVALRTDPMAWLGMGNHWGLSPGLTTDGLRVAHLPWRSRDQLARKLRQGAAALTGTGLGENFGGHWRAGSQLTDDDIDAAWEGLLGGTLNPALNWVPVGPFTTSHPSDWSGTWPTHLRPEQS